MLSQDILAKRVKKAMASKRSASECFTRQMISAMTRAAMTKLSWYLMACLQKRPQTVRFSGGMSVQSTRCHPSSRALAAHSGPQKTAPQPSWQGTGLRKVHSSLSSSSNSAASSTNSSAWEPPTASSGRLSAEPSEPTNCLQCAQTSHSLCESSYWWKASGGCRTQKRSPRLSGAPATRPRPRSSPRRSGRRRPERKGSQTCEQRPAQLRALSPVQSGGLEAQ
mmetsp:Transcript_82905/g.247310  ORF Transcript_82905/g.247310 Transcript_82905/m.247310 type:complete len:223 (+) Transcript_82905:1341-2009(+)